MNVVSSSNGGWGLLIMEFDDHVKFCEMPPDRPWRARRRRGRSPGHTRQPFPAQGARHNNRKKANLVILETINIWFLQRFSLAIIYLQKTWLSWWSMPKIINKFCLESSQLVEMFRVYDGSTCHYSWVAISCSFGWNSNKCKTYFTPTIWLTQNPRFLIWQRGGSLFIRLKIERIWRQINKLSTFI